MQNLTNEATLEFVVTYSWCSCGCGALCHQSFYSRMQLPPMPRPGVSEEQALVYYLERVAEGMQTHEQQALLLLDTICGCKVLTDLTIGGRRCFMRVNHSHKVSRVCPDCLRQRKDLGHPRALLWRQLTGPAPCPRESRMHFDEIVLAWHQALQDMDIVATICLCTLPNPQCGQHQTKMVRITCPHAATPV